MLSNSDETVKIKIININIIFDYRRLNLTFSMFKLRELHIKLIDVHIILYVF